jgi:GYF domain 2/RDD family
MTWYVRRGESELGPLGDDALRALVGTGQVTADTPLWREGLPDWTAAAALPGVLGPLGVAARAPGPQSAGDAAGASWEPASPWRRYWARCLDISVSTFIVAVLVGALRPPLLARSSLGTMRGWIILLILLPLSLIMDTVIYWALGNSPGKAIAGIKVLEAGGRRRLSAPIHLRRNFGVYVFGLGLGLPLLSLIMLIWSYTRAAAAQASIWDRFCRSRVYALAGAGRRTWIAAGVYVLGTLGLFAFGLQQRQNDSKYTPARTPTPLLQQELTQAANSVNATAPRMVDHIVRIDGAHVDPGSLFTYDYTVTNLRISLMSPATLGSFRSRLRGSVRAAVCRESALEALLRSGARVCFHYRDREGKDLARITVSSADCGG